MEEKKGKKGIPPFPRLGVEKGGGGEKKSVLCSFSDKLSSFTRGGRLSLEGLDIHKFKKEDRGKEKKSLIVHTFTEKEEERGPGRFLRATSQLGTQDFGPVLRGEKIGKGPADCA